MHNGKRHLAVCELEWSGTVRRTCHFAELSSPFQTRTAIYKGLRALSMAPNPQKVSKKSPRASRPGMSKKSREKSRKSLFLTLIFSKRFATLQAGRPGETFLRLFGDFRSGGPGDSCKWLFRTEIHRPCVSLPFLVRSAGMGVV